MPVKNIHKQSGFTLIEIAVVLVIVGILLGSFITTLSSRIDTSRQIETKDTLEEIKVALYGYAMSQTSPRLPCPDTNNDGLEDLAGAQCSILFTYGNLPWRTLGIERGDAWSSNFSYWVADEYSNTAGFDLATDATLTGQIRDAAPAGKILSSNVAAVIFSHGKNQLGSIGLDDTARLNVPGAGAQYADERENTDVDVVAPVLFVSRPVTSNDAQIVFDDILIWISEYELKGRMVQAHVLP